MAITATEKQEPLSQEELEQAAEDLLLQAQLFEEQKKTLLEDLANYLETDVNHHVNKRSYVESRWLEDLRQFHGYPEAYVDTDRPFDTRNKSREPRVNITRNKCLTAIGQMGDLQFPARDKNFRITYTPVPELVKQKLSQDPQQAAQAESTIETAHLAAGKMERTIWDQLEDSRWGPECREAIRDLVVLGTGVVKGPMVEGKLRKRWRAETAEDGIVVHLFDYELEEKPALRRVDPWYFYPDMTTKRAGDCEKCYELHPMNRKELSQLALHPYFVKEAITAVLDEPPKDTMFSNINARHAVTGSDVFFKDRYMVWEYHGRIDDEVVAMLGLDDSGSPKNPIKGYFGEIWFCQGHVLKVSLSHLEGDSTIPYAFTQWEEDESSPFGFGIPFLVRDAQRVVNSTWRMILDNSGLAAGPQVVVNKEMIKPANNKWDIEPMKIWYATDWSTNPQDAMYFFTVPSAAEELTAVLDMAMRFSDSESSMPLVAQGEDSALATTTATGLSLLLSTSNVVQKKANRNWDDDITVPTIDRCYTWNMLYNPDDSIKGDYDVVALGSTDLTARQLEAQDAATLFQAARDDPDFKKILNMPELGRLVVSSMHLPTDRVLLSPDEIKVNEQQAQDDPQVQLEGMKLQLEQQKLQLQTQRQQAEQGKWQAELMLRTKEVELKERSIQNEWEQYVIQAQATLIREQNEREQELIKLASKEDISVKELLAKVGAQEKQEETKRVLGLTDFALRRMQEKREEKELEARIKNMTAKPTGYDSFG